MKQKELAQILGVSTATVSKVFSGSKEISEETKNKIIKTAKKYGVYNKFLNKKKKDRTIVIIVPEIISEYYSKIITLLCAEIKKYGYLPLITLTDFSIQTEKKLLNYYTTNGRADGIINISAKASITSIPSVPISILGGIKSIYCDNFYIDAKSGIFEAVKTLKNYGHTRIAFIGENNTKRKIHFFKEALKFYNLEIDDSLIITSTLRFEDAGYNAVNKLLKLNPLPTAIISAYDYIAIGAIKHLKEKGFSVPKDFSVIGNDDISISASSEFSLSSIHVNFKEASKIITESLIQKIENPKFATNKDILIKTLLVKRNSIKNLKKDQ